MITNLKKELLNQNTNFHFRNYYAYLWLFFLGILAYGVLIPVLGFYWDDLAILYAFESQGPSSFPAFLASDRPFSAWVFMISTWLFGTIPFPYHVLALILRVTTAILFYEILRFFYPKKYDFLIISSSIFLVYPGFLQQPIALIYNHHFSVLCFFFLSVLLMINNAKLQKWSLWMGIVSYATTLHMFSIENFAMLELIRPILLWIVINKFHQKPKSTLKFIRQYLPYIIIFSIFLIWRIFIFKFPTYKPGFLKNLASDPINAIISVLKRIPSDFITVMARGWTQAFTIPKISDFGKTATYISWSLLLTGVIFTFIFINKIKKESIDNQNREALLILFFSLILFLLGGAIVWVLDFPFQIEFAWDRLTLALLPSVSLLIGSIYLFLRKIRILPVLFAALLIGSAIGAHFQNGMAFKRDWESLQNFFWQLSWRAPSIEEGTTLLSSAIDLSFYSDNSLTSPLNLTYSKNTSSSDLDYIFYYTGVRLGYGLPALEKGLEINQKYRSYKFSGNTSNILSLMYKPPACMKITDRVLSNSITNPNLTTLQVDELKLSNLLLIKNTSDHKSLVDYFQSDSPNGWCYYFEKADLARQYQDYQLIANLGDEALEKDLSPRDASEWLPFLDGYIYKGEWDKVTIISEKILHEGGSYKDGLCYTINRILKDPIFTETEFIEGLIQRYNC
jgi:NO-binding membrane sensor protein with MHYT domain